MNDSEREKVSDLSRRMAAAEAALSEVAKIELRRRLNVASAILTFAPPLFSRVAVLKAELKSRTSYKPMCWALGAVLLGTLLHYVFKDPSRSYEFTFGAFVILCGIFGWINFSLDTYYKGRSLKKWKEGFKKCSIAGSPMAGITARFGN